MDDRGLGQEEKVLGHVIEGEKRGGVFGDGCFFVSFPHRSRQSRAFL